jgi:hypothetical protein
MSQHTVIEGAQAVEVVRASVTGVMSVPDAQRLERTHAQQSQYYAVFLRDEREDTIIRVRTPVFELDAERNPVNGADGKPVARNVHDVALNVWAAYGADEYTLLIVMRGPQVVATPQSIANELAMAENLAGA